MSDAGREFAELKREVIEARNQAIKTDNQLKNLGLDIKGFERRFDVIESRVRISSMVVHLIVAVTMAVAAYIVSSVRVKSYQTELTSLQTSSFDQQKVATAQLEELRNKLMEREKKDRALGLARLQAAKLVQALDSKKEAEAIGLLNDLDITQLSAFENKLINERVGDLKRREADAAYRKGRELAAAGQYEPAVGDLKRAVGLLTDAKATYLARYWLAYSLYQLKRYDEAEPLWRVQLQSADPPAAEEARYWLAASLARMGDHIQAKSLFDQIQTTQNRFTKNCQAYLQAIESGSPLPADNLSPRERNVAKVKVADNIPNKDAEKAGEKSPAVPN